MHKQWPSHSHVGNIDQRLTLRPLVLCAHMLLGLIANFAMPVPASAEIDQIGNSTTACVLPGRSAGPLLPCGEDKSAAPDPDIRLIMPDLASPQNDGDATEPLAGLPSATSISPEREEQYNSFGERVGAVKWETLGLAAFLTAVNLPKDLKHGSSFHFHDEGFFGRDTDNVGVDKFAHAYNSYVIAEGLYARMKRKTGGGFKSALTSGIIAMGLQAYGEVYDGVEKSSGWSMQDVAFNIMGAGFSILRNSVPGLQDKLDFRLLLIPNHQIYSFAGKEHFRQEHFLLALKLSGFETFDHSVLRFVELQAGYSARGFTPRERARGETPQRRPFVGIGINLGELLFDSPGSPVERAMKTGLNYIQLPYTAIYAH